MGSLKAWILALGLLTGTGCISADSRPQASPPVPEPVRRAPALTPSAIGLLTTTQRAVVEGARACIGDRYDDGYYAGGPPPRGRGACTDVLYWSLLRARLNLQKAVNADIRRKPRGYPNLRDDNIDYRWAPNLIVWFGRHAQKLSVDGDWQAGDVVFWSLTDDGVADHCGIVSEARGTSGPLVIHNFPPACREDDALHTWRIMGHFRPGSWRR